MSNVTTTFRGSQVVMGEEIGAEVKNIYNSISSIGSATPTTIVTYTVPVGKSFFLSMIEFTGTNISRYDVELNSIIIAQKYTYFSGGLSGEFSFNDGSFKGYKLVAGDVLEIITEHNRPGVGDFSARIMGVEK